MAKESKRTIPIKKKLFPLRIKFLLYDIKLVFRKRKPIDKSFILFIKENLFHHRINQELKNPTSLLTSSSCL
ncbi:MAG: hypothetical protein C0168_01205 [Candidatus Aminicenantes bacterium]|nr:MAG: hypothetical protein C0168_01205 [Candidatus Aminicenantes bacterium]